MYRREEILAALEQQEREGTAYWNAFDLDAFFRKIGTHWSPAETVRHLNKSTRPIAKALASPKLVLWWMFGRAKRASTTYEALVAKYRAALDAGGEAGRFAPSTETRDDLAAWRSSIMSEYTRIHRDLRSAIARWSDSKLDRLQLPHPLMGKLTMREMLFFTLYHHRHHQTGVAERLRAQ